MLKHVLCQKTIGIQLSVQIIKFRKLNSQERNDDTNN